MKRLRFSFCPGVPIGLIFVWQCIYDILNADRWAFAGALLIYVIAKFTELNGHAIATAFGGFSRHTLKHLLARAAAAPTVIRL